MVGKGELRQLCMTALSGITRGSKRKAEDDLEQDLVEQEQSAIEAAAWALKEADMLSAKEKYDHQVKLNKQTLVISAEVQQATQHLLSKVRTTEDEMAVAVMKIRREDPSGSTHARCPSL
jgi:hypothetical protein